MFTEYTFFAVACLVITCRRIEMHCLYTHQYSLPADMASTVDVFGLQGGSGTFDVQTDKPHTAE